MQTNLATLQYQMKVCHYAMTNWEAQNDSWQKYEIVNKTAEL